MGINLDRQSLQPQHNKNLKKRLPALDGAFWFLFLELHMLFYAFRPATSADCFIVTSGKLDDNQLIECTEPWKNIWFRRCMFSPCLAVEGLFRSKFKSRKIRSGRNNFRRWGCALPDKCFRLRYLFGNFDWLNKNIGGDLALFTQGVNGKWRNRCCAYDGQRFADQRFELSLRFNRETKNKLCCYLC